MDLDEERLNMMAHAAGRAVMGLSLADMHTNGKCFTAGATINQAGIWVVAIWRASGRRIIRYPLIINGLYWWAGGGLMGIGRQRKPGAGAGSGCREKYS